MKSYFAVGCLVAGKSSRTLPMVPYGADQTIYRVVDRFCEKWVYRETEIERTDLDKVVDDLISGRFNDPVRVVAFNTLEHWSEDLSQEVAREIETRCDMAGEPIPDHLADFVADHDGGSRRWARSPDHTTAAGYVRRQ
jgi:hypothetical protein